MNLDCFLRVRHVYGKQSIFVTRAHCHTYDCISVSNPVVDSQVIMFIEVTGFNEIVLPEYLRQPPDNTTTLVLCLIRWLAPHPDARLRDADKRPVCPAPFDINHSLWRFARSHRMREPFRANVLDPQIHIFPGQNDTERRAVSVEQQFAYYDLVLPETFISFMNCTVLDAHEGTILETNILPCNVRPSYFE